MSTQAFSESNLEKILIKGDLSSLTAAEKVAYYISVCTSVGLDPKTQPFQLLTLNGKQILYAARGCTDQLRRVYGVSLTITSKEMIGETYVVCTRATLPSGRCDENLGAVFVGGLKGEAYSNALMKAITKSARRVTLSICGLAALDELEVATIPGAKTEPIVFAAEATSAAPSAPPPADVSSFDIFAHDIASATTEADLLGIWRDARITSTAEELAKLKKIYAKKQEELDDA